MKIRYTYFFLCLYVVALIRPVIPVIEYSIDFDYISKVLCINKDEPELKCEGKCQLAKEIKKTILTETGDGVPVLPVIDFYKFPIAYHTTEQQKFVIFEFLNTSSFSRYKIGETNNYISSIFHPPDFLV